MTVFLTIPLTRHCVAALLSVALISGCGRTDRDFYPLEDGRWWYFATRTTILDEIGDQRLVIANIGSGIMDGESVHIQRQSSGREVYFRETARGLERVAVRRRLDSGGDPAPATLIVPGDRTVGHRWTTTSRLRLIESRTFARQDKLRTRELPLELEMSIAATDATVRVPAGTFSGCIRIDGNGTRTVPTDRGNATAHVEVSHSEWYAPGVGLVKVVRSETTESPFLKAGLYEQELVQYD